ncbi:MAG: cupredoxin domain-containing protein [Thermomicrobiales bacterium]
MRAIHALWLALIVALALPLSGPGLWPTAIARAQEADVAVQVSGGGFEPAEVTVPAGATVTWTNTGIDLQGVAADDGSFNSGRLDPGESFSFTFETPGEVTYASTYAADQTGTVTVTEAAGHDHGAAATPDADATTTPVDIAAAAASDPNLAPQALQPVDPTRLAHIHAGNCEDLGIVIYSLPDIRTYRVQDESGAVGTVELIAGEANVPLEQLFSEPFSIHIHESPTNKATYLACADVGGRPVAPWMPADGLVLEAKEQQDSGYSGFVTLRPSADGAATDVIVSLAASAASFEASEEAAQAPAPSTTYKSPTFGYTLGYNQTWTETDNVSSNGRDRLVLSNGSSYITLTGENAFDGDPQACVDAFVTDLISDPNVSNARLATDEQGQPLEGGTAATGAFAIYDHDYAFNNRVEPYTLFVGCVPLPNEAGVLAIVQNVPTADYNEQVDLRERLLRGLTLPQ